MPEATDTLKHRIKEVMIESLMLQDAPDEIANDEPLFAVEGLSLDSVDALQLVVALEKNFGLKIADADKARSILESVNTIAAAIEASPNASSGATG